MDAGDSGTVVGQRPPLRRRDLAFPIGFVCFALIWGFARGHYEFAVLYSLAVVGSLLVRLRPATVISANGIRRPWRPRSVISWGEVRSVTAPQPGVMLTRIVLVSGKTVSLEGVPAARSADVAALGQKPVQAAAQPALPPPPTRRRTDEDVSADVERRAAALSAEWRRMEAQFPRRAGGGRSDNGQAGDGAATDGHPD